MAMHLNENLDDNGEMHDINANAVYRRDVGSADYLYGGGTVSDGRCEVNLPASTSTPQPRPEKPVYLSVKADNSMFIGNDPVTDAMITASNALTEGKKDTTIFFRADKTVDYETLMKVMDTLHQASDLKIGLVGEETAKAK